MPPTSGNDNSWPPYWTEELAKPPPLQDLRSTSPLQIKIDFKKFSGEPKDWTTWSKVHRAQLSALGCADGLTETAGDETKLIRYDFDLGSVDPD